MQLKSESMPKIPSITFYQEAEPLNTSSNLKATKITQSEFRQVSGNTKL